MAKAILILMTILGGCLAWQLTGIERTERRVHRLLRRGMSEAEVQAAAERAGAIYWPESDCGKFYRVEHYVVGYADVLFEVAFGKDGRVLDVTTAVQTTFL
jgi:hypothetical protein